MKCPKCGAEINEGASFCTYCGSPLNQANQVNTQISNDQPPVTQNNMMNNQVNNMSQNNIPNQNSNPYNMYAPNNKKTPWGLIIGAIVLAIVIVVVFALIIMSKNDNSNAETNEDKTNTQETTENKQNSETTDEDYETVTYDNFTFEVPSDFTASSSSSQLLILNDDSTLASAVIYQSGTDFESLVAAKDHIISLLESQEASKTQNYDFTNAVTEEKTYDGTRFLITSNIKQGTTDLDITYAETKDGVFVVSIAKNSGTITESERDDIYSIIASANNEEF